MGLSQRLVLSGDGVRTSKGLIRISDREVEMSKKCFEIYAYFMLGFSVGFIVASLIFDGAFI